jgi:hypothetical protein
VRGSCISYSTVCVACSYIVCKLGAAVEGIIQFVYSVAILCVSEAQLYNVQYSLCTV